MSSVVSIKGLQKTYCKKSVLKNIHLELEIGRIYGLIGPNGAGKTTLLKAILGLAKADGDVQVLGLDPLKDRVRLLQDVAFIADTAILPRWIKVSQAIEYMELVHPKFNRDKAVLFLQKTNIQLTSRVKELSKGMVTQLHLALIMAIDSKLLVLDEPTLGLDIIYRKQFYESLLADYYDHEKTILITTHQVEEIETILSDLIFIQEGEIVFHDSMESIANTYLELHVSAQHKAEAEQLLPLHTRTVIGGFAMIYKDADLEQLSLLGKVVTPSVADLFVAKVGINKVQGELV